MKIPRISVLFALFFIAPALAANPPENLPPKPTSHTIRHIEGWTVRVDDRLLNGDDAEMGAKAIELLSARLFLITMVVPEKPLAKLREVPIQLDLTHGGLRAMQYHPDADWLKENGYSTDLARCVHIPDVRSFISDYENHRMPWVVLHELSHAYHDRVLSFDDPRIIAAYEKYRDSGHGKQVLTINGGKTDHYALTNHKEFFAEMTECYFGTNDFYPFVVGELKQSEPEIYKLMLEIWGPLPKL